jgi:hypothetical protein
MISMHKAWIGLAAVLLAAAVQVAWAGSESRNFRGSVELNTDRPGGDYHDFDIRGGSARCRTACASDRQCVAWTFVRRDAQATSQHCWLKSSVPAPHSDSCCVSGVMQAPATPGNDEEQQKPGGTAQ